MINRLTPAWMTDAIRRGTFTADHAAAYPTPHAVVLSANLDTLEREFGVQPYERGNGRCQFCDQLVKHAGKSDFFCTDTCAEEYARLASRIQREAGGAA